MKLNELMIGDWVYFHNGTVVEPRQVTGVLIPDCIYLDFGYEPHTNLTTINLVEPIPLTGDILEKNGWRGRSHTQWKFFRDGCDNLNILLSKDYTQVEYLNMIYNPEDNAEVNYGHNLEFPRTIYVHELQHVLRLCEIDKTIEL